MHELGRSVTREWDETAILEFLKKFMEALISKHFSKVSTQELEDGDKVDTQAARWAPGREGRREGIHRPVAIRSHCDQQQRQ